MSIEALSRTLSGIIPSGILGKTRLPQAPEISLWLLEQVDESACLDSVAMQRIMDNPLYWIFCWASGQVLARQILDNPDWVRGKRVLDFGCGSGVVAIAAKLAGAKEAIACDIDLLALEASQLNAELNGVELTYSDDFENVKGNVDLLVAADVLYDRENLPWLDRFMDRAGRVLVADSRIKNFDVAPYRRMSVVESATVPDLGESRELNFVTLYCAAMEGNHESQP